MLLSLTVVLTPRYHLLYNNSVGWSNRISYTLNVRFKVIMKTVEKKLVTFVLVQIFPGLTLPQRCVGFMPAKKEFGGSGKNSSFHWFRSGKLQIFLRCRPRISGNPDRKRWKRMSARLRALLRSMSWLLVAWVILIVAAVTVPVFHVVFVVVVVVEEVGAFVGGRGTCADAVFGQRGGHLHAVALGFRLGGQHLFPEGRCYMISPGWDFA